MGNNNSNEQNNDLEERKRDVGIQLDKHSELNVKAIAKNSDVRSNFADANKNAYEKERIGKKTFEENKIINKNANNAKHDWNGLKN